MFYSLQGVAQRLALCPARRYAAVCGVLVGGARQRRFDGTHFKPRKLLENAATPTRRVVS